MTSKIHEGSKLRATTLRKKLFLFLTATTLTFLAPAQINKGRMMLGGSFNIQNNSNTSKDSLSGGFYDQNSISKSTNVALRYGYFIADGFMVGVFGGLGNSSFNTKNTYNVPGSVPNPNPEQSKNTSNLFSAGVFTRYYKMIGQSKFAVFGELAASAGKGKSKITYESNGVALPKQGSEGTSTAFSAIIRPGLTYFFTNKIAAEASFGNFGYSRSKNDYKDSDGSFMRSQTSSGFTSNLNFSLSNISLGINFYFGG